MFVLWTVLVSASSVGLDGRPIQVVKVSEEHSFELVEENLASLLNRPDVKNKPVVVVSVAGAFRKGKSFLLNFFIRYLTYITKSEVRVIFFTLLPLSANSFVLFHQIGKYSLHNAHAMH